MRAIISFLQKHGKVFLIGLFLLFAFLAGNTTGFFHSSHPQVLGIQTHKILSPTPSLVPTVVPTGAPITIINNIIVPTSAPIPSVALPSPTPIVIVVTPTPTSTPAPTATPSPTSALSPTPVPQTVTISIEYASERSADSYTTSITPNETAWQAVQNGVGLANLHYTDYGGTLGIFITGFNGIDASPSQYYDFQVNGVESQVGVSSYTVQNNDQLKFILTND